MMPAPVSGSSTPLKKSSLKKSPSSPPSPSNSKSVSFLEEIPIDAAQATCDWKLVTNRSSAMSSDIDYGLCPSYPAYFVVPAAYSERSLREHASFRHNRRIPVAVWRHPTTCAVLCRSSCPAVASTSGVTTDDKLLAMIRCLNPKESRLLYVVAAGRGKMVEPCDASSPFDGCQLMLRGTEDVAALNISYSSLLRLCAINSFNFYATSQDPTSYAADSTDTWYLNIVILSILLLFDVSYLCKYQFVSNIFLSCVVY